MAKLFSNNSIYKRSLVKISAITILILLPLNICLFYNFSFLKKQEVQDQRRALEKIINHSLIKQSQYGDLIYSRAEAIEIGKKSGLIDIGICIKHNDIFERINETRCKGLTIPNTIITNDHALLGGKAFDLEFRWKIDELPLRQILIYSAITSFLILTFIILPVQLILLKNVLNEVNQETKKFLLNEFSSYHNQNIISQTPEEFKSIATLLSQASQRFREQTTEKLHSEIARRVSHDIRSPIAALNQLSPRIQLSSENENILFKKSLIRINEIADSFLEITSSNHKSSPTFEEINALIGEIVEEATLIEKEKCQISLSQEKDKLMAFIIPNYFKRILSNLINNSLESSNNFSNIEIHTSQVDKNIIITIRDNGNGIPKNILDKLGREEVTSKQKGNGIGFKHSLELLKEWQGDLKVISTGKNGTTIQIELLAQKEINKTEELSSPVKNLIVLVDDDELTRATWEMKAKKSGISLRTYKDVDSFKADINNIKKDDVLYIDSELGEIKGESLAAELHELGFQNISMASGHPPEKFAEYTFLKSVISKKAPF